MKVIVIGAGVQGIATAYNLQRYGAEVSVLDAAEGPGLECSFANGGGIHASVSDPWNAPGSLKMLIKYLGREDSPMLFRLKALPSLAFWGLRFLSYAKEETYIKNTHCNGRLANYSLQLMKEIRAENDIEYSYSDCGMLKIFRSQRIWTNTMSYQRCCLSAMRVPVMSLIAVN